MGQKARSTRLPIADPAMGKRSHAVEGEEPKSTHPPNRDVAHSSSTEISGQLSDETEQLRTVLTHADRPCALRPEIKSSLKQGKTSPRGRLQFVDSPSRLIEAVAVISRHPDGITSNSMRFSKPRPKALTVFFFPFQAKPPTHV